MDHHMRPAAGVKCGRWNPTAEQVKVLTDLFSSGLRTPTTEQIQMISSHLSSFGKIESKNVFYWFQNHKARERHYRKRRRAGGAGGGGGDLCCRAPAADHVKKEARSCARTISEQEVMINLERKERDQIETLELFPLMSNDSTATTTTTNNNYNSLEGSAAAAAAAAAAAEKLWRTRSISTGSVWKEWRREMPPFVYDVDTDEISDPPPLDLRLSFL